MKRHLLLQLVPLQFMQNIAEYNDYVGWNLIPNDYMEQERFKSFCVAKNEFKVKIHWESNHTKKEFYSYVRIASRIQTMYHNMHKY